MAIFYPRCKAQLSVVFDGRGAPNSKPLLIDVQPRNCSVTRNGYHEADTWNMEIDARLLPFDPDQIASCEIRIFMWDSQGDDSVGFNWAIDKYEMIRGLVDEDEGIMVSEDNSVKLTGRDYTGVLLDIPWQPKSKVPTGLALDALIQDIADQAAPPNTRARFEVSWRASEEPPIVGAIIGKVRSTKKKGFWVKPGKTYWDVIYDIAISNGFIAYVTVEAQRVNVGTPLHPVIQNVGALRPTIVITDPQTQTTESLKSMPRLAYGRHLTKLSVKRKFAREKVPQMVLVAWNPITKTEVNVTYPEKRNVTTDALGRVLAGDTGSVAVSKDDQEFVPAPKGIYDPDTLRRYARMRFYHCGRAETEYTFNTAFLSISSDDERELGVAAQDDFDLLRLKSGDAVGIAFDPFNREHLRALTVGERVEHITSLGYEDAVAQFIANNLDSISSFEQPYYFKSGKFDFDIDDGLEIQVDAVNFASEVREVQFAETPVSANASWRAPRTVVENQP